MDTKSKPKYLPGEMPCTYVLRCADNSLYTGWTNNLDGRIKAHNQGLGAKYTRGRGPVTLVHVEYFSEKTDAMKREAEIKKLPRAKKEELISSK